MTEDDDFDRRLESVVRVATQDIASDLRMKFTPAQRKAVRYAVQAALFRWMDHEREMWGKDDDDDEPHSPMDDPPAGSA